jgi:hypothetical protein
MPAGGDRWTAGSGYLIGSRLVLTAAHNVDYRRDLGGDEQLLVRTIEGNLLAARVVLVGDEVSGVDLALLEISDPGFGEQLLPVTFARVDRDNPAPVTRCWAVGFPRFGEAGPVLPGGGRRETWQVSGHILPGGKRRAGLLSLQVTSNPSASLTGSAWEGMSGAVVFAADAHDGEQAAVGVISTHHRPEGESALTVAPVTAVAELAAATRWWQQLGVPGPDTLLILPRRRARAGLVRPTSAAGRPLTEVTDPFVLEVHRPVQPEDAPPGLPVSKVTENIERYCQKGDAAFSVKLQYSWPPCYRSKAGQKYERVKPIKLEENIMQSDLEAKQAITEAIYRYCRAMDRIDPELAKTVWHGDATLDYGRIFKMTAAEYTASIEAMHAPFDATHHQVGNILIDVDGDRATSEAYVTARCWKSRHTPTCSRNTSRAVRFALAIM